MVQLEQKQLDELDESYFGEEFVDDEDVKIEPVKSKKKAVKKKTTKKTAKKVATKQDTTKESTTKKDEVEVPKVEIIDEEPTKDQSKEKVKPEPVSTYSPSDPWDEQPDQGSLLKEPSTWKMIAGVLLILLIFSVVTSGFSFDKDTNNAGELTLQQAEAKALEYVNTQLLQPPFVAELVESKDAGDLFLVTLNVAGQNVDSYLTKDGSLFFPQGFQTQGDIPAEVQEAVIEPAVEPEAQENLEGADDQQAQPVQNEMQEQEAAQQEETEQDQEETQEEEQAPANDELQDVPRAVIVNDEPEAQPVEEQAPVEEVVAPTPSGSAQEISLAAKRWLFAPSDLKVAAGSPVRLTVTPSGLDFTFAIPQLGVEQLVSGTTVVEFTPAQPGTYEFTCSSCEAFRGMTGTLVVE